MTKAFRKQKLCYEAFEKCKQRLMYLYIVCDRKSVHVLLQQLKLPFQNYFINSDILIHQ